MSRPPALPIIKLLITFTQMERCGFRASSLMQSIRGAISRGALCLTLPRHHFRASLICCQAAPRPVLHCILHEGVHNTLNGRPHWLLYFSLSLSQQTADQDQRLGNALAHTLTGYTARCSFCVSAHNASTSVGPSRQRYTFLRQTSLHGGRVDGRHNEHKKKKKKKDHFP